MGPWLVLLALSVGVVVYSYALYPLLLLIVARVRRAPAVVREAPAQWPYITITLPAYNAQDTLRPVLEGLVHTDYPRDRRQIVVVSDGSTDGTDDLVREYASHGVELLRIEGRLGKTEIENRAFDALRGEIIVNTDASVTIDPKAVRHLVAALGDPTVGVASGRDVSVSSVGAKAHVASEAAYVGYEMWVRDLETAVGGIIGSSGCLYAIRAPLHRRKLPGHLSRDFSSALWAQLNGVRAVSVRDAVCFVPRSAGMHIEYRRKIRTMSRGIQTLFYHKVLLDPIRYGVFAWCLWSHKLIRWLVPWAMVSGVIAVGALAVVSGAPLIVTWGARLALTGTAGVAVLSALGWYWRGAGSPPKLASTAAYFVSGTVAALVAWKRALLERGTPVWEPTPRALTTAGS
ncbi:MAG: glycosyltransferase [Gemmatimonadaceae bacterium]|nr:glycosyltransferase [Gemmatimonadaceae bacterium]